MMLFIASGTNAQNKRKIAGTVTDESGEPIIGASVMLKGTNNGTITSMDGTFQMEATEGDVLRISYIGFLEQQVTVTSSKDIKITMLEDLASLDEVIVIGYGTAKRRDFTGSVSSVKLEDSPISLSANTNPMESLKGAVTGLDVGYTNSAGGEPGMLVRGQNSISGSNNPLIVVDGVIFMGSINDINPNDIASVDVLKDATSAAVYGSRSANGVICITTKKGKTDKPMISFNARNSY